MSRKIEISHIFTAQESYEIIKNQIAKHLPSVIEKIDYLDGEKTIIISGKGVKATAIFAERMAKVDLELGFFLKAFAGEIESKIKESILKILGNK